MGTPATAFAPGERISAVQKAIATQPWDRTHMGHLRTPLTSRESTRAGYLSAPRIRRFRGLW